LDTLDAFIVFGLRGMGPIRILQSIASGLLGASSYKGGPPTAALGLVLHFFIATSAAAVYFTASLMLPVLIQRAVPCGATLGIAVNFLMNALGRRLLLPSDTSPTGPRTTGDGPPGPSRAIRVLPHCKSQLPAI
jgi:hypothetical protein